MADPVAATATPAAATYAASTEAEPIAGPPAGSRPTRSSAASPPDAAGFLPALQSLLYVLIAALFLMTFTVQPIRIPSASMEPTLLVGDFLLMDKQSAGSGSTRLLPPAAIAHGDVIVFHDPVDDPSIHLVKRVIGLPGDRIHLRDGVVFRNGKALEEPYTVHRSASPDAYRDDFPSLRSMDATVNPNWWIRLRGLMREGEITVPAGSYFVMGDNRNNSEDSRYWGFVPREAIVGKPLVIYFSWRQPGGDGLDDGSAPLETAKRARGFPMLADIARWDRTFRVVQ